MNVFYNTQPMVYEPHAARAWRQSDVVRAVLLVVVIFGLCAGWFE